MTIRASDADQAPELHSPVCLPQHRRYLLAAAVLASSMGFIDSSVTAVALPAMRASLGASLEGAQWISASYLLTMTALVLVGGAMGDRFGIARVFAAGIAAFVLFSLACALAVTPAQMIIARALQGLAAGVMVPGSMSLVARAYPRAERGAALGLWAAASTATTAFGPVLGGLILSSGGPEIWRVIFALNLPLGLTAWVLLRRYALADPGQPGARIDIGGAILAIIGLGLIAAGLTTEGPLGLPLCLGGLVGCVAFVLWERRVPQPMIRLGMFANRAFAAANLATFLLYFAITGVGFYLPMTAMSAWGLSPVEVTLALLPVSILIALMSAPVGRLADRIGPFGLMASGAGVVALSQIGLVFSLDDPQFWTRIVPLIAVSGFGIALVVAPLTIAVMREAGDAEQGAASGINNVVARAATLVAVALLGRVAAEAYGPGQPGFGIASTSPAHLAATAAGFAWIAGLAAAASLASAVVSALQINRRR